jgi:ribulose 1,5-bisphosphate carboxylase large subunit-like protein
MGLQMGQARFRDHTTARRALQQTLLQQKGLHHSLKGGGIFPQTSRQRVEPNGAAAITVLEQMQQAPVAGIEAAAIHPVQAEGLVHQLGTHLAVAAYCGHITHPPQQAIGNARRAPAAARHLQGSRSIELDLQQAGRPLHDRLQIIEAVKLQPLDQAEAIPQG